MWRICVRNGSLKANDDIKITCVNIDGYPNTMLFDVNAKVKTIREDFDILEDKKQTDIANKGCIVTIDLSSCYVNGNKIDKTSMQITNQSIGISSNELSGKFNKFFIEFTNDKEIVDIVKEGQDIILLWFGKRIYANIIYIPASKSGIFIQLRNNKEITIPHSCGYNDFTVMKNIVMCIQYKSKSRYISGLIDFDKCVV